jgi:hypothetical protein
MSGELDGMMNTIGDVGTATAGASTTGSVGSTPNPAAAMLYFFIVTVIYCIISIFLGDGNSGQKVVMKIGYLICVMIGEFFINLNLSGTLCGEYQWQSAMLITLVPWLFIFGVIQLFLSVFPGWLSPFSNTFGYLVVKLMGLSSTMKEITVKDTQGSGAEKSEVFRIITELINDPSLLINQFKSEAQVDVIDPATDKPKLELDKNGNSTGKYIKHRPEFEAAWKNLQDSGIIKKDGEGSPPADDKKNKKRFYNYVEMKATISELIWNLLTGMLVTSVSYNYIINTGCKKSAALMKKKHDDYQAAQKKKIQANSKFQANQPNYVQ